MRLVPVREGTQYGVSADALYLGAFPDYERIPVENLHRFAGTDLAEYYAIEEDGFRGLAYTVTHGDIFFLLYLAIAPGSRGNGCGSRALDIIKGMAGGRKVFLNMEPVDPEADNHAQRVARRRFYERNGFTAVREYMTSEGVPYTVMTWGEPISEEENREFVRYLVDVGMFPKDDSVSRS